MALRRSVLTLIGSKKASLRVCGAKHFSTQTEPKEDDKRKTHFGFETVNEDEKTKKVHQVFETVADKYDLMNDVMSLGVHRVWKDIFMMRLAPTPGTKLLDMAGGTGDISFRYLNYLKNKDLSASDKPSSVTVCDINQHMLDVGKARAERQGYSKEPSVHMEWLCADAERLPLADDTYSAYTVSFGIRNCTRVDKVLEEAYRVLQPGGRFLCLEFSQLPNSTMQWMYDQYSFQMIPVMGQLIAGQWKPYKYLVESIRQFPDQEKFKSMIEEAGFRQVTYENLTFGICAIHSGFKL
ncbi:2-methoxy-6-polyprenyl-1,4-benzoquinol methylase, mitochondrial [Bicyclus anynana]|uniref:2-methoxy-6-polyprenyl-1,4-benzoquinol methylase, mitochondrial n=1 Tax=Bicyclus anynana TaxID=110368 RepID=A0A6J1N293_BICAN|nr:2-methoxy-6-polyprenyl-1,4-benzoquinol methylase, mitochondrial [Bicyclus anynana]